jgi:hypothetical protein
MVAEGPKTRLKVDGTLVVLASDGIAMEAEASVRADSQDSLPWYRG